MVAYLSADLIASSRFWTPSDISAFAASLRARFADDHRVIAITVSQGDSFQLETAPEAAFSIALLLDALARDHKRPGMRVAFAIQNDPTGVEEFSTRSGPAYVAAGRGILALKQRNERFGFFGSQHAISGWKTVCSLCSTLVDGHTERQSQVLAKALETPDIEQNRIAAALDISQQAVSKHLAAGHISAILSAEAAFSRYVLNQFDSSTYS